MIPIILMYLLRLCTGQFEMPTFVLNMDSQMEYCDEESLVNVDISGLHVGRYNETTAYMYGITKLLEPMGFDTMLELIVQREVSGQYETVLTHEICDLCAEVASGEIGHYYDYIKYITVPESCPLEVGDYPMNNLIIDTDDLPLNANTAGRYQTFYTIYKNPAKDCKTNKEFMWCVTLKFLVEMV